MKFRCWDEDRHEEADGLEIEADEPEEAAEKFCERRFSSDSYPQHRTVHVLALEVRIFDVETRQTPEFHATARRA